MQEVGESLISILVVGKEGLLVDIYTRDSDKSDEKRFIGAFSSLAELILKKLTLDFDLGTFGAGTFDTDKYRFIFCESGSDHILVSILDPLTLVDDIFPYTYMAAEKVSHIIEGDIPVSPVIPRIKKETEIEQVKRQLEHYQKKWSHSPDFVYKLSLVGNGGVGKTSIVQRYVHGIFSADYKATIGTYITKNEVKLEPLNTSVKYIIWDLAGQEQFKRIWPDYLTDSHCGIIVFDITDRKSFENVKYWYDTITRVASPNLILILTGNKIDLTDSRVVSREEGENLAKELGIYYMETSAKTNEKIDNVFEWISFQLVERHLKKSKSEIISEKIEKKLNYIISDPQLRFLEQHFIKQLEYCIDKKEAQKYLKYLETLKTIEKTKF